MASMCRSMRRQALARKQKGYQQFSQKQRRNEKREQQARRDAALMRDTARKNGGRL